MRKHLIAEQQEKRESESDDEEEEDGQKLEESPENVGKHHHENAKSWDFTDKQHKFKPR